MEKKKNIEENIVDTQEVKQEDIVLKTNTVSSEVQEEVQDDVHKKQEEDKKEEVVEEEATECPESVKNILHIYPNYPALYIDSKGGVYPEGTQPNWVADTILYQNPYYKS